MPRQFVFDPRQMISGPWHTCPACGAEKLGTLSISDYGIERRCRGCLHSPPSERLPPVPKKVVYLDQFVFSEIAKALDPVWREERPGGRGRWLRLFDGLDRALKLQLIVCPESPVHEKESIVHRHYVVLRRLYRHFAAGTSFEFPTRVHAIQLGHALRSKLEERPVDFDSIDRSEVVHGPLDAWIPRIQIHVDFPLYPDSDLLKRVRENSGRAFQESFERWRQERRPFDDVYHEERLGHAQITLILFQKYATALQEVQRGINTDMETIWNPRMEVATLLGLSSLAEMYGIEPAQAVQFVGDFLESEDALTAPHNEISSLLMAGLCRQAASGQLKPPSQGMWNDMEIISAYLPFCDAMFLDRQCASLLADEPIKSYVDPFGTRIFSVRTGEEFLAYLTELEVAAGSEHTELVIRTYGEEWLRPFREILEHEREREKQRGVEKQTNSEK